MFTTGPSSTFARTLLQLRLSLLHQVLDALRQLWPAYLLGSILIFYGFAWGLPDNPYQGALSFNADENAIVYGVHQMRLPSLDPGFFAWGTAVFYQAWIVREFLAHTGLMPQSLETVFWIGRAIVYVYAMGVLTLVYFLGKKLFGSTTGRLAAIFLVVMPGFVQSSHYFKMDVPTTFWLLAGLLAAVEYVRSPGKTWLVLMGLFFGYAASTKYTSVVILPVGIAAIWLSRRPSLQAVRAAALYLAAGAAGFLFGTPYALIRPDLLIDAGVDHASLGATIGGSASPIIGAPAWLDYTLRVLPLATTLPLAVLAGAGILLAILRRDARFALLLVAVASYYVYLAIDNYRMVRYTVPLLPLAALLVAYVCQWLSTQRLTRLLTRLGSVAVVGYAFVFSLSYVQAMAATDPRVLASEWIATNVPRNQALLVEDTSPTDSPRFDLFGYSTIPVGSETPVLERASAGSYLVVSEYATRPFATATPQSDSERREFWSTIDNNFEKVADFENSQKLLGLDSKYDPWSITHDWLQPNPRITVYRRINQ